MMRRAGFNMVEVLIALVLVGIISIAMVSFVNDHHQRYRLAIARADLNRIAESIQLAEQRSGQRLAIAPDGTALSSPTGGITSMLSPYLLELPPTDPWGNKFVVDPANPRHFIAGVQGDPYVVDAALGRLICAGPDGEINTSVGQDPADNENDLVVEFRRKPWIAYSATNQINVATADAAVKLPVPNTATPPAYVNVAISPDGTWYAAIKDGSSLVVGPVDETSQADKIVLPRASLTISATVDTFPLFYPNGASVLFVSGKDLYRYDIGLDRVIPLTSNGFFGGGDSASGSRTMASTARGANYTFQDGSGATFAITISLDGKLAFSHPDPSSSGIYLVSASGGDAKTLKGTPTNNSLLPVAWAGTDSLIYQTNPALGIDKYFYRIRLDGKDTGLALHPKPIPTGISLPSLSPDGNLLSFLTSDTQGALLRTDGSGFVSADHSLVPYSWGAGIDSNIVPCWKRDSQTVLMIAKDGTLIRVKMLVPPVAPFIAVETISENTSGTAGLHPRVIELNTDETLCGMVSGSPPGLYIIPMLGPNGARTALKSAALGPGETPVVRWLDHQ